MYAWWGGENRSRPDNISSDNPQFRWTVFRGYSTFLPWPRPWAASCRPASSWYRTAWRRCRGYPAVGSIHSGTCSQGVMDSGIHWLMDWWIDGLMDWWIDGLMDWWIDGLMDWWIGGLVNWWTDGLMDWWIDGLMDWWIDGLMDWWIDGLMDWWIDGFMNREI